MSYDFSFNKKTFSFLLGGCAFVGVLLFIAGLLVGASWKTEPPATSVAGGQQVAPPQPLPPPSPAPDQAAVPKEPALRAEAVAPRVPNPSEALAPNVAPPPVKQAHRVPMGVESRRVPAVPMIPEGDDGLKIIQEAETPAPESTERSAFSVQVGVFAKEGDANQLVRQLQGKGYTPFVLTANDNGSKVWYAVRVGSYTNWPEAAEAAANFTKQEKIQTMVRPLGGL